MSRKPKPDPEITIENPDAPVPQEAIEAVASLLLDAVEREDDDRRDRQPT